MTMQETVYVIGRRGVFWLVILHSVIPHISHLTWEEGTLWYSIAPHDFNSP